MKSAEKKKARRQSFNKLSAAKRGRKSRAVQNEAIGKVEGVNRDNTLANWVAGMEAMAKRGSQREGTLCELDTQCTLVRTASR
jgi:hypothetical protein